jgi:hypothetical protein
MYFGSVANAQEADVPIEDRIANTFALVRSNEADLAVPLTRRALAWRLSDEDSSGSLARAAALTSPDEPVSTATIPTPLPDAAPVSTTSDTEVEEGSADDKDSDVARLPRPRPSETEEVGEPDTLPGDPLDLVAAAALPLPEPARSETAAEPEIATASEPIATAPPAELLLAVAASADGEQAPALAAATDESASVPAAAPELVANEACLEPEAVNDKDDDFSRNAELLSSGGFCIAEESFKERRRNWTLQTVATSRPGPLWAVMHDDEDAAFDNALQALKTYGGTLIAVEAGGRRNQDGIDPNRNFSADGIGCSKLGDNAAPRYTEFFKNLIDPTQPIIALHINPKKPTSTGGLGHASMTTVPKDMRPLPAPDSDGPLAGEHALVLLTAMEDTMSTVEAVAATLNEGGVNVIIESVRKGRGDCSLSNYAALSGHHGYFNVTVDHDEAEKQRKILGVILAGGAETVATQ